VAVVFAREITPPLTSLVKRLDEATTVNKDCHMGSFVVFLSDEEKLADQLKHFAKKEDLKKTILTIDNPAGPGDYDIAKDADVTVLLYVDKTVKANHAYAKGAFTENDIPMIIRDLSKILPKDEKK